VHVAVYLPLVASLVLVGLSRLACRRISPRLAAWSIAGAVVVVAGSAVGALALLAWPLVARIPVVADLGRWRVDSVAADPVPIVVSVLATGALAGLALRLVRQLQRLHGELVEARRLHDSLAAASSRRDRDGELAVLDDPRPTAHALAGTLTHRGRVVVSTGLLAALDDDERAAVLAHEHAHLAHGHRFFDAAATLASAINPLLAPVRRHLAFALERWADEDAAARTSRPVAARALTRAALARLATPPGPALPLDRLGVPQRVTALLRPPPTHRAGLAWLVTVVALASAVAVAWATHDTEELFEALRTHTR
jgi:beta-lactamase regulating signal transducer with metallopeptidase domain